MSSSLPLLNRKVLMHCILQLAGWMCNESEYYHCVEVIEVSKNLDEVTVVYPNIEELRKRKNGLLRADSNVETIQATNSIQCCSVSFSEFGLQGSIFRQEILVPAHFCNAFSELKIFPKWWDIFC